MEKNKKLEEYQNRMGALQANYIDVSDEDLAEGGADWDEVGIKAIDDYTIEMTLDYPIPASNYWTKFASGGATSLVRKDLYEAGMNETRTETDYGTALEKIDFCGPYVMTKWDRDLMREYVKNENSPLKDLFTPQRITEIVVEDDNTAMQLFENCEIVVFLISGPNL